MKSDYQNTARMYKAFCDESRIEILELLKSGEYCACELLDELKISQSTLSHHMKILTDAGIVTGRKEGRWMHYLINQERILEAQQHLSGYLYDNQESTHINPCCKV